MSVKSPRSERDTDRNRQPSSECEALCQALLESLLSDRLPPDDAYWWTRILVEEVVAVAHSWLPAPTSRAARSA